MRERPEWELEITREGVWPLPWSWMLTHRPPDGGSDVRCGDAWSKDAAYRRAMRAKVRMEREEVRVAL